jgi:large subunit ribosomal protein L15
MKLHTLKPAAGGASKPNKRLGRGEGSGWGGTSTRGHKGAKSRSGYSHKIGFEGGQMPLQRRVPKFGFKNPFHVAYQPINLDVLQALAEKGTKTFTLEVLLNHSLANKKDLVKVLGRGELKSAIEVHAHAFSTAAKEAIEKAGGKVVLLSKKD